MNRVFFVLLSQVILASVSTAQWSLDATVNNPISTGSNDQVTPAIASDGAGGAIITWADARNGTDGDIYAQRINSAGVVQWSTDGVPISTAANYQVSPTIISDGVGGAIISWVDYRSDTADIYAQRINSAGVVQWSTNGVPISTAPNNQDSPIILSDGSGGAIITWQDFRSGTSDIYAQRINSAGVAQWTNNGVAISTAANNQFSPQIISDDVGGAIITWFDGRSGTNVDIYAQRINSAGAVLWTTGGAAISTDMFDQSYPKLTGDGAGGAIITWRDTRYIVVGFGIYAQRIDSAGVVQWTIDGVGIFSLMDSDPLITSDSAGGAIIAWSYFGNIYAQAINSAGVVQWTTNGVAVSTAANNQFYPKIISDNAGGAIIIWQDFRNGAFSDIYAQRINSSGGGLWTTDGVTISTASNSQESLVMLSDGSGGAIIAWHDFRSGAFYDIFAQNADRSGNIGYPKFTVSAVADIPDDQGGKVRVTWHKTAADTSIANSQIMSYSIWRKIPSGSSANKLNAIASRFTLADDSLSNYDFLMTIPAVQISTYNVIVPTLEDSSAAGTHWTSYRVSAHTGINSAHYVSDADSGYSINNYGNGGGSTTSSLAKSEPAVPLDLGLVNISDITHDQGGQVRLRWSRSSYEDSANEVLSYSIWRKIPAGGSSQAKPITTRSPLIAESLSGFDYVATIPALQSQYYNAVVPTLMDSNATDIHRFTFVVTAHTGNINTYFDSPPDSGYSVDNISPSAVTSLTAQLESGPSVSTHWNGNTTDPDFSHYEIHRSTTSNFTTNPSTKIGETPDTSFVDGAPAGAETNYYRVVAVDIHGNSSAPSPQAAVDIAGTFSYDVADKWNMVSVPLTVNDYTKSAVYPSATSNAFAYEGGYVSKTTLTNGTGYWLKFSGTQSIPITGFLRTSDTISVTEGWNMIGSISTPISTSGISSNPPGMITGNFFGYTGSYTVSDSIRPGTGYWVKVNTDGQLILSSGMASPANRIKIVQTSELPPPPPDGEIANLQSQIPDRFALEQNYPNPFNPTTIIRYQLPVESRVTLKIFNVLGQEVATLVDEVQDPGYKSVTWDAQNATSGMYFCKLMAGSYVEVKKMIMIR